MRFSTQALRFAQEFGKKLKTIDLENLSQQTNQETIEKLWICEHFKLLPTDKRVTDLTEDQISIIISNYLNMVPEDEMKKEYWKHRVNKAPDPDLLLNIGYSKQQIDKITKEINNA